MPRFAGRPLALGNAGAGMGATAGPLKGGLGTASAVDAETGITVGGAGPPPNPLRLRGAAGQRRPVGLAAGARRGTGRPASASAAPREDDDPLSATTAGEAAAPGGNTTLMVVALDAALDRPQLRRIAMMAQDGLARAVRPAHTPFDGDTLFALATGARPLPGLAPRGIARLGADRRRRGRPPPSRAACFEAAAVPGFPDYRSRHRGGFRPLTRRSARHGRRGLKTGGAVSAHDSPVAAPPPANEREFRDP